jgi:hypothetical protein
MQVAMAEASHIVLGFELGTDVAVTRWPARYADRRGTKMWEAVMRLLLQQQQPQGRATA